jgi:uncharacterized protein DUF4190
MKYCPQCNKQYAEAWLTFCTDDGSLLREDLTPPADPNWDPRIRPTKTDDPSEYTTQWLPGNAPPASGWMMPSDAEPVNRARPAERPWQPPPPPPLPQNRSSPPGIAIASFILGIIGVMIGLACAIPLPGIIALLLGIVALAQMRSAPNSTGRGLAIAGIVMGAINVAIFVFAILWIILSATFG